jgi:hypothetical protein
MMAYVEVRDMEGKMLSIGIFSLALVVSWLIRMLTGKLGPVQPAQKLFSVTWNS